mmetsp:Transcript_138473/g.258367  ORF Transcript_138473/g.258367 Transcript_138473/m.258367 type:complete len:203 (-) Transcript_138473:1609-2217(-)
MLLANSNCRAKPRAVQACPGTTCWERPKPSRRLSAAQAWKLGRLFRLPSRRLACHKPNRARNLCLEGVQLRLHHRRQQGHHTCRRSRSWLRRGHLDMPRRKEGVELSHLPPSQRKQMRQRLEDMPQMMAVAELQWNGTGKKDLAKVFNLILKLRRMPKLQPRLCHQLFHHQLHRLRSWQLCNHRTGLEASCSSGALICRHGI